MTHITANTDPSPYPSLPAELARQLAFRRPMRVTQILLLQTSSGPMGYALCPKCGVSLEREYVGFCDHCGQMLDWSSYAKASYITAGQSSMP